MDKICINFGACIFCPYFWIGKDIGGNTIYQVQLKCHCYVISLPFLSVIVE